MSQEGFTLPALKLEKETLQNQDKHLMGEDEHSVSDFPKGPEENEKCYLLWNQMGQGGGGGT